MYYSSRNILFSNINLTKHLPYIIVFSTALFFLFEFIQINIFSSIDPDIMKFYQLSSVKLSFLSSIYFYSTAIFLLPAGQILDRFSERKVILITLMISIISIFIFSMTNDYTVAAVSRFFEGIASAFCFLGCFRVAVNYIPEKKLASTVGVVVTIGMLGGVLAQTPVTLLIEKFGWRNALILDALLGLVIFIVIFTLLKDIKKDKKSKLSLKGFKGYFLYSKNAYFSINNIFCGVYTCFMNSPLVLLGALWGSLFLEQSLGFNRVYSSIIVSMLFFGTIAGSPVFGFLSDHYFSRKRSMIIGSIMTANFLLILIFLPVKNFLFQLTIFFLIGVASGSQVLGYPTASQNSNKEIPTMSVSIVSLITMSGYIFLQPLFGIIIGFYSKVRYVEHEATYSLVSYQHALLLLPVLALLSLMSIAFIKEPNIK